MAMKDEIDAALQAHAAWRKRFKDYLYGHAACDVDKAATTDQCDFGGWLDKEGHRLMPTDLHEKISAAHGEFHRIAGEIVRKIKKRRYAETRQDIAREGAFNHASAVLSELLLRATLREAGAPGATPPVATAPGEAPPAAGANPPADPAPQA